MGYLKQLYGKFTGESISARILKIG